TPAASDAGRPLDLPFRLTFGAGSAWTWTRSGWYQDESWGAETARWSRGRRSVLSLPLPAGRDIRLDLDCQPFVFTGSGTQRIAVVVDDVVVEELALLPNRSSYSVVLPAARLPPGGATRPGLSYAAARPPRKAL